MTRLPLPTPEFESISSNWGRAEASPYRTLLRLALARDLARLVHAGISGSLADREKPGAGSLRELGHRLESLKGLAHFDFGFESLLDGSHPRAGDPGVSVARSPSPATLERIGREKLLRYDRAWEAALAAEADVAGWTLWRAEADVPLRTVSAWNDSVARKLFPRAIVLYCEKSSEPRAPAPELWPGSWVIVAEPALEDPRSVVPDAAWKKLSRGPGA